MSTKFVQLSVLSLALLAVVSAQTAAPKTKVTQCYQCNSASHDEEKCESTGELQDSWKKACKAPTSSSINNFADAVGCRKITQKIGDESRTIRECAFSGGDVDAQKRTGNKGIIIYYYQCSSDNCNGSSSVLASFGVLLMAAVASLIRQ